MISLKRLGKRADEKYYIIISIILGLVVLFLVLYFIFQEYFTSNELNYETCRQSIVLRNNMPEKFAITISLKDKFPLKCKTQAVNINFQDTTKAESLFADTLAQCFYLTGEGKYNIFPSNFVGDGAHCLVCARIHINPENLKFYTDNPIDFQKALLLTMPSSKQTYFDYLGGRCKVDSNWKTSADCHLPVGSYNSKSFNITSVPTNINLGPLILGPIFTSIFGSSTPQVSTSISGSSKGGLVEEPEAYNISNGDLLVVVSSINRGGELINTYLTYVPENDINKLSNHIATSDGSFSTSFCESYETVPA